MTAQRTVEGGHDPGPAILIVTGMSGAGRTATANVLEDSGWYVVDNLPPRLLPELARLGDQLRDRGVSLPVAAVVDARAKEFFADLECALAELAHLGWGVRMLFLDATDEALVRRFESVRRPHPLQGSGRLLDGIQRERALLGDLRADADVVLDTSGLPVAALTRKVESFVGVGQDSGLRIAVLSFGFKYGIPLDADFVFDLRFLPNPYWVPELKARTGQDAPVAEFVLGQPIAADFVREAGDLLRTAVTGYRDQGRRYVTVALGCTGGKHRSVAVAEAIAADLTGPGTHTFVVHRDLGRE